MQNLESLNLKVIIGSQCQLFSLPTIKEAVRAVKGEIVGVESQLSPTSLNRSIKRHQANLLILTIDNKDVISELIPSIKKSHPSISIITIALKLRQIPILVKTRMIKAILFASEDVSQLIQAIKRVTLDKSHYSPKASEAMALQIAGPNLTPREQQVNYLIEQKKSRDEIASLLEISYVTVNTHIRNINRKQIA